MPQPVTVYRWDDPGAPQLSSRTPSEIIDILTKCLVDGYGAKAPLGWTRPFYDASTQAVAFRNNVADGGSGGYVKIFSNNGSNSAGALMRITHAVSMTDINDLFNQGYTHAFQSQTNMLQWALIGTSAAFYFFITRASIMASGTFYNLALFAGDIFTLLPSDAGRFISVVTTIRTDATGVSWSETLDYLAMANSFNGNSCLKIYDADGFSQFYQYGFSCVYPSSSNSAAVFDHTPHFSQVTYPVFIKMNGQSAATTGTDRFGTVFFNSTVAPVYRGVLPGMVQLMYAGWRTENWPHIIKIGDDDHWLMKNSGSGAASFAIKLGEWINPYVSL